MLQKVKNRIQGVGLGLRFEHFDQALSFEAQDVPWFEVIMEDFLSKGPHHIKLSKLLETHSIVFHSVGLNLGGVDKYDLCYLKKVKAIYDKFNPEWVSDHLCWSSHNGKFHHDLLPIPKTIEALENVCNRINFLQDFFERELVIENVTSYVDYKSEDFTELEFIKEVLSKTNCSFLLDISNVVINHRNRGTDPIEYLESFPLEDVKQIHLAGGTFEEGMIIDSHAHEVEEFDIEIYKSILEKGYNIPAMIERDSNLPSFQVLNNERRK